MIFNVYFGSNGKMGKPTKREFENLDEAVKTVLENSISIPLDKNVVRIRKDQKERRAWLEWDFAEEDGSVSEDFHYIEDADNSLYDYEKRRKQLEEMEARILREAKEIE